MGKALKGKRHKAVVCSKVSPSNARPETLRNHCEASLKRLGTDYLDIYMLHWPINYSAIKHFTEDKDILSNPPSVQEAFETLIALQKEGKIRHIGVSNFGVKQIAEAKTTEANIILNEIAYNILSRAIEKDIVPYCFDNDIAIVGSMALQQGLLAGIYATAGDVPHHQAHSRHFRQERGMGTSRHNAIGAEEEIFKAIGQLKAIASELDVHIAQLAIAWVIAKPGIKCTLVGSRDINELEANVKAGLLNLSNEIINKIDIIGEPVLKKLGYNPDMEMGHGDEIVIGDGNFPAASCAQRLVRCDGNGIPVILDAILKLLPLDYAVENPVILMALPAGNTNKPVIWKQYFSIISKYEKEAKKFGYMDRFAFYERAKKAYAIIATGERARFSNIILKKGIICEDEVTLS